MEWNKNGWTISTDKSRIDTTYVHAFLTHSYWAEGIPHDLVVRSIEGSLCFGLYDEEKQAGFARAITDAATFAYIADVFIDPAYRGQGLGRWLVETMLGAPELQGLRRMMLATRDAHALYAILGFSPVTDARPLMQVHRPGIYTKTSSTTV